MSEPPQKVNCSECMAGIHFRCRDAETCLCAESEEHINSLKDSKLNVKTYTESSLNDAIKKHILSNHKLLAIVDSIWAVKFPTLRWNPTDDALTDTLDEFLNNESKYRIALRRALREVSQQRHPWMSAEETVRFVNECKIEFSDSHSVKMAEWGPQHTGIPLATDCIILALEERELITKSATAKCVGCKVSTIQLETDPYSRKLQPIPKCGNEGCSHFDQRLILSPKDHITEYAQKIIIQEPMEEARHGSPVIFECEVTGNDVYNLFIGQRKRLIGVFTAVEQKREVTQKILIRSSSITEGADDLPLVPTTMQITTWMAMAKDSESYLEILLKSFAPEIYKDDQTRLAVMAIIVSLVRGTTIDRLRGEIHTLLVGDPSLGKTKLLEFLILVTQKSAYVNGRMASGPGLTVGMDQLAGGKRVPRAGPVPLCDGGFVALDEMGRVKKDDLTAMHECMESGTISFTKAGYNFKLKARTTIIGAANPVSDSWDNDLNTTDNIGLSTTILSRCDFIVNLIDKHDDINDQKKMQHILKMRRGDKVDGILTVDEFTRLLNYVRMISPVMTKEAEKMIADFYNSLRKLDQKEGSRPVDTRLSESLIRISTALAKLHFSKEVTIVHVEMALDLVKKAFHTLGMKVEEGQVIADNDTLVTTKEQAVFKCARILEAVVKDTQFFPYDDLINMVFEKQPEQFDGDKDKIIAFVDKQIEHGKYLRKGTDLRIGTR